jgi:cytochrome b6-f complex iron-sulfur subunit
MTTVSRRTVLGTATAGAGVAALSACGASAGPADIGQGANDASANAGSPAPSPSSGVQLVKLSQVPVGGSVSAQLDSAPIVVSQQAAGAVTAFSAICTHMGCTVGTGGPQLHCPCHGSVYNAFTGAVIHGPAPKALKSIPVKVSGGSVVSA